MNDTQFVEAIDKIIEKQEKEMKEGLHKVGKLIYAIHEKSVKLSKCLPDTFHEHFYPGNGTSFKNDDFRYSEDLHLGESITLDYKGKYNFIYREIKNDENSNWEICLSDLDDKVTALDIYATVSNLLEWLDNYCSQNENRIKDIIEALEIM